MRKGKRFELAVKNNINDITHEWVKAHRPDYSGNSAGEVADIMVVWKNPNSTANVAYVELKKRSGVDEGNRKVVMSGSSDGQSGLDELKELINESPPWTEQYVGVKFQNRELIVYEATTLLNWLTDGEVPPTFEDHGARLTASDNISIKKPTLSEWPSSTAGKSDERKLLHEIGVKNYDIEQ